MKSLIKTLMLIIIAASTAQAQSIIGVTEGNLYGLFLDNSGYSLITIDKSTGIGTRVDPEVNNLGLGDSQKINGQSTHILLRASAISRLTEQMVAFATRGDDLYSINVATGTASPLHNFSNSNFEINGMVYDQCDILYVKSIDRTSNTNSVQIQILDLTDYSLTPLFELSDSMLGNPSIGQKRGGGLAYWNNKLHIISSGYVSGYVWDNRRLFYHQYDLLSGQLSLISNNSFGISALSNVLGASFDANGVLYVAGNTESNSYLMSVDTTSGVATRIGNTNSFGFTPATDFAVSSIDFQLTCAGCLNKCVKDTGASQITTEKYQ